MTPTRTSNGLFNASSFRALRSDSPISFRASCIVQLTRISFIMYFIYFRAAAVWRRQRNRLSETCVQATPYHVCREITPSSAQCSSLSKAAMWIGSSN
jgi:hypothetical protein